MVWCRIDDALPEDPRWDLAGAAGLGLHVAGLAYCNRNLTDGLITMSRARRLIECPDVDRVIELLLEVGIWRLVDDDAVELVGFLEHQPSADKVRADRERKAARQARWVERQRTSRDASHVASVGGSADHAPSPSPTRPEGRGEGTGTPGSDSVGSQAPRLRRRINVLPLVLPDEDPAA